MDQTTHHLLTVLAEFYEDRVMHDVYGIEDDSDAPLEIALRNWSAAGFPDTVASSARIAEVEQERDGIIAALDDTEAPEHDVESGCPLTPIERIAALGDEVARLRAAMVEPTEQTGDEDSEHGAPVCVLCGRDIDVSAPFSTGPASGPAGRILGDDESAHGECLDHARQAVA